MNSPEAQSRHSVQRLISSTWSVFISTPEDQWLTWCSGFGSYFDAEEWRKKQHNKDVLRVGRNAIEMCAANDKLRHGGENQ